MTDLNDFMSADPLDLTDQDLDKIIAYQRRHRANVEAGVKVKKETGPKLDLKTLLSDAIGKPAEPEGGHITRR